jgi:hypothetical protein
MTWVLNEAQIQLYFYRLRKSFVKWVADHTSPGEKRPEHEAHRSSVFSAEVSNLWSFTSTLSVRLHSMVLRHTGGNVNVL